MTIAHKSCILVDIYFIIISFLVIIAASKVRSYFHNCNNCFRYGKQAAAEELSFLYGDSRANGLGHEVIAFYIKVKKTVDE